MNKLDVSPKIESIYNMLLVFDACSRSNLRPPNYFDDAEKIAGVVGIDCRGRSSEYAAKALERVARHIIMLCELPKEKWPWEFARWQDAVIEENSAAAGFWLMQLRIAPPGWLQDTLLDD